MVLASTPLFPITAPLAEPPRQGSGALLPTLGRLAAEGLPEREVGFAFDPEGCGESDTLPEDPCDTTPATKTIAENPGLVGAPGFVIWTGDKCSAFDFESRDFPGRAQRQLAAVRSYQVAHELWTGDEASSVTEPSDVTFRWLAHLDSDTLTAGPTSPTDALAELEYALGQCGKGRRGVIHVTRHAATFLWSQQLLRREGNQLLTGLDTIVIADAGYDGSGPEGQPMVDGSQWAYATGMPIVQLGAERILPGRGDTGAAINRGTNTIEWRAEQKAAVGWDQCCHLAAEINLQLADIGGAGS